jgi:hypothetical protein
MASDAGTQKIFGVAMHGELVPIVGLGSLLAAHRLGGDFDGWAIAVAAAVVVHEAGQLAALRALGSRSPAELGLHSARARTASLLPWQGALAALAGPALNALVGLVVLAFCDRADDPAFASVVERFGVAGLTLAAVEVAPVLPLDGGVALRALLEGLTRGRGDRVALRASLVLALVAAAAAYVCSQLMVTAGALVCAVMAGRAIRRERADARDRSVEALLADAEAAYDADDLATARRLVTDVLARSENTQLTANAAELGAWIELRAGDARAAKTRLESMPRTLRASSVLRATLRHVGGDATARATLDAEFAEIPAVTRVVPALVAFGRGDDAAELVTAGALEPEWMRSAAACLFHGRCHAASAVVSQRAFERTNLPDHAYNAACALAQAKRPEEAVVWLAKAIEAGFSDGEKARTDDDLAPLRVHSAFAAAIASLGSGHPYRA